jgi:DNA-directed RNA polymerase subunit omega
MAEQRSTMIDPPIEQLLDTVDSKFTLVTLASKRGRQINSYFNQLGEGLGAIVPPQVASVARKPLSIALEEIAAGKVVAGAPKPLVTEEQADDAEAAEALAAAGADITDLAPSASVAELVLAPPAALETAPAETEAAQTEAAAIEALEPEATIEALAVEALEPEALETEAMEPEVSEIEASEIEVAEPVALHAALLQTEATADSVDADDAAMTPEPAEATD